MHTASEICAAFQDANETAGYVARTYSTDALEQVHFKVPSGLIKVIYDCWDECFYIKFEKYHATWGDYVRAICNSVHYIMKMIAAGGLDVRVPEEPDAIEIRVSPGDEGRTRVKWADAPL